jgi:hypothetical protein
MKKECPSGQILRKGYTATRKRSGIVDRMFKRGTTYRVKSHCVTDTGKPGKGDPVIGKLKTGALTELGYSTNDSVATRHIALEKAVKKYGKLSTFRKLNAASVLTKNTLPSKSKTMKADRNWVKKTYF